jgi:hypothetical protein
MLFSHRLTALVYLIGFIFNPLLSDTKSDRFPLIKKPKQPERDFIFITELYHIGDDVGVGDSFYLFVGLIFSSYFECESVVYKEIAFFGHSDVVQVL